MKKNLAKRIVLGLLTGAVLMSSSVAWAGDGYNFDGSTQKSLTKPEDSISIIGSVYKPDGAQGGKGSIAIGVGSAVGSNLSPGIVASESVAVGHNTEILNAYGVALGSEANVTALGGVALGANTKVETTGSVALGIGSAVNSGDSPYVVSVGSGVNGEAYATRSIINVTDVSDWKTNDSKGSYAVNVNTLKDAVGSVESQISVVSNKLSNDYYTYQQVNARVEDAEELVGSIANLTHPTYAYVYGSINLVDAATKLDLAVQKKADITYVDNNFVRINTQNNQNLIESSITIKENNSENPVTIDTYGITVGEHSTRMDGKGFYVWADNQNNNINSDHDPALAIASMTDDGKIKAAGGKFEVGADGSVKAAGDKFKIDKDGNVSAEKITAKEVEAENLYTKAEIDEKLGGSNASVAGINQRLDRTNAKINKVGAGAAALAALHPLDYDPDDKLTFSAGMGNYAGENAAALGAFYRPNEKFMVSLGGTMGNGENMVNLGISIGLDKANGFAKMSKRELIQEVNAVKAENEAIKADNEAMKAEMAEMKAMLQELLAKK